MRMTVVTRETAGGFAPRNLSGGISVFESAEAPADPRVLSIMDKSLEGMDLAAPPVVLPDFHHKPRLEMPSSIAVATRHSIRPTLTSAAVNCGMALIAFDAAPPSEKAVTEFFTRVREKLPEPAGNHRDLSAAEVVRCALEGAHFAADRFGINAADLRNIEEGGRLDLEHLGGIERARRQLPRLLVELSRMRFGIIGASNHFIELQRVEEIYDEDAARRLGVAEGQLTLQYHGGGGILTGVIGRLFGRREDYPLKHRAIMAFQKPVHHLASARSMAELRTRLALYFTAGSPPVTRLSPEGERLLLANAVAMNYGFAFRLATYAALRELGRELLGLRSDHLVVDSPHDSMYEEELDGETVMVHRHNSSRAFPASRMRHHPVFGVTGQPVLLPGTNRTSSFLCVANEGAHATLNSTSHGTGTIVSSFERSGASRPDHLGRSTLRFNYRSSGSDVLPHLDDRGVNAGLAILVGNDIVHPVARMRPIAGLN